MGIGRRRGTNFVVDVAVFVEGVAACFSGAIVGDGVERCHLYLIFLSFLLGSSERDGMVCMHLHSTAQHGTWTHLKSRKKYDRREEDIDLQSGGQDGERKEGEQKNFMHAPLPDGRTDGVTEWNE